MPLSTVQVAFDIKTECELPDDQESAMTVAELFKSRSLDGDETVYSGLRGLIRMRRWKTQILYSRCVCYDMTQCTYWKTASFSAVLNSILSDFVECMEAWLQPGLAFFGDDRPVFVVSGNKLSVREVYYRTARSCLTRMLQAVAWQEGGCDLQDDVARSWHLPMLGSDVVEKTAKEYGFFIQRKHLSASVAFVDGSGTVLQGVHRGKEPKWASLPLVSRIVSNGVVVADRCISSTNRTGEMFDPRFHFLNLKTERDFLSATDIRLSPETHPVSTIVDIREKGFDFDILFLQRWKTQISLHEKFRGVNANKSETGPNDPPFVWFANCDPCSDPIAFRNTADPIISQCRSENIWESFEKGRCGQGVVYQQSSYNIVDFDTQFVDVLAARMQSHSYLQADASTGVENGAKSAVMQAVGNIQQGDKIFQSFPLPGFDVLNVGLQGEFRVVSFLYGGVKWTIARQKLLWPLSSPCILQVSRLLTKVNFSETGLPHGQKIKTRSQFGMGYDDLSHLCCNFVDISTNDNTPSHGNGISHRLIKGLVVPTCFIMQGLMNNLHSGFQREGEHVDSFCLLYNIPGLVYVWMTERKLHTYYEVFTCLPVEGMLDMCPHQWTSRLLHESY